jgi:hypothetical protein
MRYVNVIGGQAVMVREIRRIADEVEAKGEAELLVEPRQRRKEEVVLRFTRAEELPDDAELLADLTQT